MPPWVVSRFGVWRSVQNSPFHPLVGDAVGEDRHAGNPEGTSQASSLEQRMSAGSRPSSFKGSGGKYDVV